MGMDYNIAMVYLLMLAIGVMGGFLSGLLGIGGGIVIFPALYYLPAFFGLEAIDVKSITGLTMIQGFVACTSAWLFYRSRRLFNRELVFWLGGPMCIMALVGAVSSAWVSNVLILVLFGILALVASLLMLKRGAVDDEASCEPSLKRFPMAATGALLGFILGIVGQGGAFIVIPLMLVVFRVPFRVAVGTMLAMGMMMTTAGLIGKAGTGQVPLDLSAAMLLGAIPFAQFGGRFNAKVDVLVLKRILAVIIIISTLKIWLDIKAIVLY